MPTSGAEARAGPPRGGRTALVRPRLLERLRLRFSMPVTVVAAPAGCGKTTLIAQATEENRLARAGQEPWLTCTASDAAASSLAARMAAALETSAVRAGGTATGPVPSGGGAVLPPDGAAELADAIAHRSPSEVVVILDDVHLVPKGSPGAELLAALVSELPRNGHLVLSGRPPLPVPLARLEVEGKVLRVGESDLLLTQEELNAFARSRGVPRDRLIRSGGWPALAELAAEARDGVEAAYLWEEVLGRIPKERRRQLALLAHIGPFDAGLAAAALDAAGPVDPDELTADLPLVAHTGEPRWSIHSLWRPVLSREVTGQELDAARRRVGEALATRDEPAAAVRQLGAARAWGQLEGVVVDALGASRPPLPGDLVASWLNHLPPVLQRGPLGTLLDAVSRADADPTGATRLLQQAADGFRDAGQLAGELACIAQLAQLAWWREQLTWMATLAARVLELEAAGHPEAVPLACMARALVADVANDSATTLTELDRIPSGAFNQRWRCLVDLLRSTSLNHLGRPDEALEAAVRGAASASEPDAPLLDAVRLQARWFQGHVDEATRDLPPVVDRIAATGLRNYTALVAASCAVALAYAGRPDRAARQLERARGATADHGIPLVAVNLAVAEAAIAVARGDEAAAARTLGNYLEEAPLLGSGHTAAPQQRTLALWYVLVPSTREAWETAELGPCWQVARDLARAVVSTRAPEACLPGDRMAGLDPGQVRAHLPVSWATELALARVATGGDDGWAVLEALWPGPEDAVRRLAARDRDPTDRAARAALARLPVRPAGHLELRLLGPTELSRDGRPVEARDWRRERVRSLLAHLVLNRPVARERLSVDLWPDLHPEAQARNLRVTLSYLLRVLEPDRAERDASFLVRPHGGGLLLHRGEWLRCDAWTFDELWEEATAADRRGLASLALEPMRRAVGLWRDDPVELATQSWALPVVEDWRIRLVTLATRAGDLHLAGGQPDEARHMAGVALAVDSWSEPAHRIAVSGCMAAGDRRGAQAALERYRQALADLGMDQRERDEAAARLAAPRPWAR